jgi:hypothetical protein
MHKNKYNVDVNKKLDLKGEIEELEVEADKLIEDIAELKDYRDETKEAKIEAINKELARVLLQKKRLGEEVTALQDEKLAAKSEDYDPTMKRVKTSLAKLNQLHNSLAVACRGSEHRKRFEADIQEQVENCKLPKYLIMDTTKLFAHMEDKGYLSKLLDRLDVTQRELQKKVDTKVLPVDDREAEFLKKETEYNEYMKSESNTGILLFVVGAAIGAFGGYLLNL